ncbi:MAG: ADP-ribosylglycohydrolase family protein [Rubrivivax sp.]|nr:MAG: ADP-ribosylglycohydrolase family protein [Rubrivivax sp.]
MAEIDLTNDTSSPEALAAKFERHQHLLPVLAEDLPPQPQPTWPPLDAAAALDRAKGCLLGLAIGEAIGSAVEYLPRGGFDEVTGPRGGGPLNLAPGEWTDGTAMALCLGRSLIGSETVEQYDFMSRLAAWLTQGEHTVHGQAMAVGDTTRAAIERFLQDDEPSAGPVDGASAGNGSLIRLAPLALFSRGDGGLARFWSGKQSRATHGTLECLDACELFAAQLVDALAGADKAAATRPRVMQLAPNALAINGGDWKTKSKGQIRSSAYVIDTLEAALWAIWRGANFRDAVLRAVNLGGDAAGLGAVAGQLAGALYGASGIPAEWLALLARRDEIEQMAADLLKAGTEAR